MVGNNISALCLGNNDGGMYGPGKILFNLTTTLTFGTVQTELPTCVVEHQQQAACRTATCSDCSQDCICRWACKNLQHHRPVVLQSSHGDNSATHR